MKRAGLVAFLTGLTLPLHAQTQHTLSANDQRARDIFEQLININTTGSSGSTTVAANAMAKRLTDAGFPAADVQVIGLAGSRNHNLVARFRGTGSQKPILLLAHIDVVEAKREDWSLDPFTFTEKDGFFYGRGTMDIKDGAAILVATLARLKQEGYRPNRDLILALTTGEEGGSDYNGVQWLLENHRDLVDAAYLINMDAGDPVILDPIERVTRRLWNIPVFPVMETGATDGLYFRNAGIPVYGVSGVFVDINDIRAHGRDERIGVQDYYDGAEYIYQLVRAVSSRGGN